MLTVAHGVQSGQVAAEAVRDHDEALDAQRATPRFDRLHVHALDGERIVGDEAGSTRAAEADQIDGVDGSLAAAQRRQVAQPRADGAAHAVYEQQRRLVAQVPLRVQTHGPDLERLAIVCRERARLAYLVVLVVEQDVEASVRRLEAAEQLALDCVQERLVVSRQVYYWRRR